MYGIRNFPLIIIPKLAFRILYLDQIKIRVTVTANFKKENTFMFKLLMLSDIII